MAGIYNQQSIMLVIWRYGKVHVQISCMFIFFSWVSIYSIQKGLDHKLELGKAWKRGYGYGMDMKVHGLNHEL